MIICFSGTGNSLYVANELSARLGDDIVTLPVDKPGEIRPADGRIIWVFPVYSWGIPPVLKKWISRLNIPGAHKLPHFAVMTCGDDVGKTDETWRTALSRRGWIGRDTFSVQMPNTYVMMKGFDVDPIEVAQQKIEASGSRIDHIAEMLLKIISNFNPENDVYINDLVRGRFAGIKTGIIYPLFKRFAMSPKPFFANEECISCGICAQSCPMGNIKMVDGRPQWSDNCAFCLRCYHICPRHAVSYTNATAGKGQSRLLIDLVKK